MTDFNNFIDDYDDNIHAEYNSIESLNEAIFPTSPHIKAAYLDDNLITTLSGVTFPENLTLISLRNNQITSLEGVTFSTKLTELYLSNNRIGSLAGVVFPPMLSDLDLSHNPLITLDDVRFPESLRELRLLGNTINLTDVKFPDLIILYLGLNRLTHTIANNDSIKKNRNKIEIKICTDIKINGVKCTKCTNETIPREADFSERLQQLESQQAQQAQQAQQLQKLESQQLADKVKYWFAGWAKEQESPGRPSHVHIDADDDIDEFMIDGGKKRQSKRQQAKRQQAKRQQAKRQRTKRQRTKRTNTTTNTRRKNKTH
jgi:hypothetical protein